MYRVTGVYQSARKKGATKTIFMVAYKNLFNFPSNILYALNLVFRTYSRNLASHNSYELYSISIPLLNICVCHASCVFQSRVGHIYGVNHPLKFSFAFSHSHQFRSGQEMAELEREQFITAWMGKVVDIQLPDHWKSWRLQLHHRRLFWLFSPWASIQTWALTRKSINVTQL
jgi:hypothetical protein